MRLGNRGLFAAVLMIAGLSGCGKAEFGDSLGGPGPGEGPSAPPAAINLILGTATLPASAALPTDDGAVTVSAVVTDANNATVENATVVFAASSGVLAVTQAVTGPDGIATATLGTGGDPTLRNITVTAASGGVTRTATVQVVSAVASGPLVASLQLLPLSGTLASDADTADEGLLLTAVAKDANNAGVGGVQVVFAASSGLLQAIEATTNENGFATARLTTGGDPTLRSITVTALGGGQSASHIYSVVNPQTGFGVASLRVASSRTTIAPGAVASADGAIVTVFATDANGNAVVGAPVTFSATSGQLVNVADVTDDLGRATAVLTTGGDPTPRAITVTAKVGSLSASTAPVQVADGTVTDAIVLTASATRLDPNGTSTANGVTLTATVRDANGAPIPNVNVFFNQDSSGAAGSLNPISTNTNSNGQAVSVLTTGGNPEPRDIVVTAEIFSGDTTFAQSNPVTVTVRSLAPVTTVNVVSDTNILSPQADTLGEGALVTAFVLGSNGVALVGVPVTFTTTTGALLQAQSRTDENGAATVKLTTGGNPTPRTATITATADGISGNTTIQIRRASSLDLSLSAPSLPANADTLAEAVTVTATLLDEQGQPISGVPVTFAANGGDIQTTRAITDASGTATASLTTGGDSSPRNITVTATATVGDIVLTRNLSVPVVSAVGEVTLIASPAQLPSGASTVDKGITVTAIVKDADGVLVSGAEVAFSAPGAGLQVTRGTTDATGTATAILTTGGNPTNRIITVTATSGNVTDSAQVQVIGTTLQINGPIVLGSGDTATYQLLLRDSSLTGIPGRTILINSASGNQLSTTSVTTNAAGAASFTLTGTASGPDTITVTSSGATSQLGLEVVADQLQFVAQCNDGDDNDVDGLTDFPTDPDCVSATDNNESEFPGSDPVIEINGPANPLTVRFTVSGTPTPGRTVTFTTTRGDFDGTPGAPLVKTTTATDNGDGTYTVSLVSDGSDGAGEARVTATEQASGASVTMDVEFISTTPTNITLQASPATIPTSGTSTLTAVVRDASGNLVANQQVDFALSDPTGGSLSQVTGITNSLGTVSITYHASSVASATNGVVVTATVDGTSIADDAVLTVGGQALFITLGTGNEIKEPSPTTYALPYAAIVSDAAGNPAPPSTVFRLQVISVAYQKGVLDCSSGSWQPAYSVNPPEGGSNFGCPSEDLNANGNLEPGEDNGPTGNQNGRLDPGNVVTVPSTVTLDENGVAEFELVYPQDHAYWVQVTLRATASVAGSESVAEATFVLPGLASDYNDCAKAPPGPISPYGVGTSCTDPN